MSLTIVPFEQSFGTLAAGIIDTVGAKGDAATILKRANTTAAIAAALSDLATGNLTAATGAILAAIQSNPNLDPAVALALVNVLQIVALQWQALQAVSSLVPFLSTSVACAYRCHSLPQSASAGSMRSAPFSSRSGGTPICRFGSDRPPPLPRRSRS